MKATIERVAPAKRGEPPINVLIVDDNPLDAERTRMELRRARVRATYAFARDARELRSTLRTFTPDIILCDFAFPGADGFAMQRIARRYAPDSPLIFVSGTISEERAVMALRTGAVDYVMKSNLLRLPTAVDHAVRVARERMRLQTSLREAEALSRHHAERLQGLWNIVNDPAMRDGDLFLAMLRQATATVRPGQGFRGMLWRVEGDGLVLEALTKNPDNPTEEPTPIGARLPLAATIIGNVIRQGGGTRAWDDVAMSSDASDFALQRGTHTLIVTTFAAGGSMWGLTFASHRKAATPLGPLDCAYVEVLASFFANYVQQRWQFDRIQYQQSHDVLTGLLNRSQFRSRVRTAASGCDRFAVVLADVNDFHAINDAHGHMIGDALLVEVSNALQRCALPGELVGRIASDAFGLFVPQPASRAAVEARVRGFADVFARPFSTGDREGKEAVKLTASFGFAAAPEDAATIDTILGYADLALLAAKSRGHGTIARFEPGMADEAQRRATLKLELAQAIAEDQFELYFQPHIDVETGAVTGCEALIRWNHPVRGLLAPATFIPFAEQIGVITDIDRWVMRNELDGVVDDFRLYFNLSGRQAADTGIVRAFTAAARAGVPLGCIGVEITESDAMRDVETTRQVCRALRRLNVKVAIDDFGTGYSSLSSLKRLPVDIVKIDRSFVSGVLADRHDATIAETIISISKYFGFESLAEGVEQPGELAWLRQRGCRYAQGYAISHALPLAAFKVWLAARG